MIRRHKRARLLEVLLVEDNQADARYLREIFREERIVNRVTVLQDGYSALRYLRGEGDYAGTLRPDIVLLDINLPGRSGLLVLEEIRRDPQLSGLPVILLSTSSAPDDIKAGSDLKADGYLVKPPDPGRLLSAVAALDGFGVALVAPAQTRRRERGRP